MTLTIPTAVRSLSPGWWGAVAGAAVAGATLLPDARIVAGLAAAGAMLWLAVKASAPCCAGCADAAAPMQQQTQAQPQTFSPMDYMAKTMAAPTSGGCAGCGGLS